VAPLAFAVFVSFPLVYLTGLCGTCAVLFTCFCVCLLFFLRNALSVRPFLPAATVLDLAPRILVLARPVLFLPAATLPASSQFIVPAVDCSLVSSLTCFLFQSLSDVVRC